MLFEQSPLKHRIPKSVTKILELQAGKNFNADSISDSVEPHKG